MFRVFPSSKRHAQFYDMQACTAPQSSDFLFFPALIRWWELFYEKGRPSFSSVFHILIGVTATIRPVPPTYKKLWNSVVFRKEGLNKTNVSPILIWREKVKKSPNSAGQHFFFFGLRRKLSVTTIFYFNARLHFINHRNWVFFGKYYP